MPKKKVQTIIVDLEAPNVSSTLMPKIPAPLEIERVKYNNLEVIEVLNDGKETADHYHCRMSNDTTMHVPKSLFNE